MPAYARSGIIDELRLAIERADRDGTAALNALMYGAMLTIGASVALVAIGGFGGAIALLLVWLSGAVAGVMWIAPHLVEVRRSKRIRAMQQRESMEAARVRAVDILLDDDIAEPERRAAAEFLISGDR